MPSQDVLQLIFHLVLVISLQTLYQNLVEHQSGFLRLLLIWVKLINHKVAFLLRSAENERVWYALRIHPFSSPVQEENDYYLTCHFTSYPTCHRSEKEISERPSLMRTAKQRGCHRLRKLKVSKVYLVPVKDGRGSQCGIRWRMCASAPIALRALFAAGGIFHSRQKKPAPDVLRHKWSQYPHPRFPTSSFASVRATRTPVNV